MKRLILLRHAKAVPAGHDDDHLRDLAARGIGDAAWVGATLQQAGWCPDLALVSDATRTRLTYDLATPWLEPMPRLRLEPRLYEASVADILAVIAETAPEVDCLLVVGHNPGMAQTALRLARDGDPDALARLRHGFPTATLAVLAFAQSQWDDIAEGGVLDALLTPDKPEANHDALFNVASAP